MRILVTGAAGFIGFHAASRLLARGDEVVGLDNLNDYYDVRLKRNRLDQLRQHAGFSFLELDLGDRDALAQSFAQLRPQRVVHLAAQAGVRLSIEQPEVYVQSNLVGFLHVLEGCRHQQVEHLVYASSSSVYGANAHLPFSVCDHVDHPISLYAASKKANELMAHSYAHLFGLPCTGLRFFTVYGPWGRPDMAMHLFTRAILDGQPIDVFNKGRMRRDFTYIDDAAEALVRVLDHPATPDADWSAATPNPATSNAPYRIYNVGNHQPVELLELIELLEKTLGRPAIKNLLPMAAGDVRETFADVEALSNDIGFRPETPIEQGIERFVAWFRQYYGC